MHSCYFNLPLQIGYTEIIIGTNSSADLRGNNWLLAAESDFPGCLKAETTLELLGMLTALAGDRQCRGPNDREK